MATLYTLRGTDNQYLGEPTLQAFNRITNIRVISQDNIRVVREADITYEGETKKYRETILIANNDRVGRMEYSYGSSSGVASGELFPFSELVQRGNAVYAGTLSFQEYEEWLYKGTDVIDGSREGGSLRGWTHGGDDAVYLHSGDANYIDAGDGNDYIQNFNIYSDGVYRGGNGNDRIAITNGEAWGGAGNDVFNLVPIFDAASIYSYANVMDYEIGVDTVFAQGPVYHAVSDAGLWLSVGEGETSMLIKNIYDINQVTFDNSFG